MEKAYDLEDLGARIVAAAKADGLALAEDAAEKLAKSAYFAMKDWAKESADLSESKVDDFLKPFYDYADQFVLPQIDKMDLDGDGD